MGRVENRKWNKNGRKEKINPGAGKIGRITAIRGNPVSPRYFVKFRKGTRTSTQSYSENCLQRVKGKNSRRRKLLRSGPSGPIKLMERLRRISRTWKRRKRL